MSVDITIKSEESDIPEPTDMVANWVEVPVSTVYHLFVPDWDDPSGMPVFDAFEEEITEKAEFYLKDGDYPCSVEMPDSDAHVDGAFFVRDAGKTVKVFIAG